MDVTKTKRKVTDEKWWRRKGKESVKIWQFKKK